MRAAFLLSVLALLASLALGASVPVSAQEPAFATEVVNEFPQFLRFRLTASAPAEVTDVTLRYRITGSGSLARARPEEFEPGTEVSLEARVPTGVLGFVPVGSEFVYHWELTLDDGSTLSSETAAYFYLPPDKAWQSVHNDFMRIYYHGNREDVALRFLDAGERTYARMGALLQTELEIVPVTTILFASESNLEEAQPVRSESYDAATSLCGTQVADNILFVTDSLCGTRDRADTLRHEFTHILTKAAGESALGKIPSWLDEGTAVYSQTEPGTGYVGAFEVGVAIDRLISFDQMITGNRNPRQVGLFYGQSYEMVRFLIARGGEGQFARLFATIKAGNRFDAAIETVYGFDIAGFEDAFRAAHGLPPRQPAPTPTPAREQPAAGTNQAEPEESEPGQAVPASDGGDGRQLSSIALGAIGGGAGLALLALLAYLFSLMLGNRARQSESAAAPRPPAAPPPEAPEPEPDEWGPPPP